MQPVNDSCKMEPIFFSIDYIFLSLWLRLSHNGTKGRSLPDETVRGVLEWI